MIEWRNPRNRKSFVLERNKKEVSYAKKINLLSKQLILTIYFFLPFTQNRSNFLRKKYTFLFENTIKQYTQYHPPLNCCKQQCKAKRKEKNMKKKKRWIAIPFLVVKFKQKTTITKRNTWWNLIIAMWQQKEEKVALPEFMRQAHYFKNKHKKKTQL